MPNRTRSSQEQSARSALVEWERCFRAAARKDNNRILRVHLRELGLLMITEN